MISMSKIKESLENNIFSCPFYDSCRLPKDYTACFNPFYKICPEFQLKKHKMNKKNVLI